MACVTMKGLPRAGRGGERSKDVKAARGERTAPCLGARRAVSRRGGVAGQTRRGGKGVDGGTASTRRYNHCISHVTLGTVGIICEPIVEVIKLAGTNLSYFDTPRINVPRALDGFPRTASPRMPGRGARFGFEYRNGLARMELRTCGDVGVCEDRDLWL